MTGERERRAEPAIGIPEAAPARLAVEHVAKTYVSYGLWPIVRRVPVLTDASLEVGPGEVAALVGGNGSGKSTLMMIIAGALSREAGSVRVDGRIGYCPQYPVLYEKLTVAETFRLFGVAYGLDGSTAATRKAELMATLAFGQYDDFRVEHLSGGNEAETQPRAGAAARPRGAAARRAIRRLRLRDLPAILGDVIRDRGARPLDPDRVALRRGPRALRPHLPRRGWAVRA
jgi:hypothetical protein